MNVGHRGAPRSRIGRVVAACAAVALGLGLAAAHLDGASWTHHGGFLVAPATAWTRLWLLAGAVVAFAVGTLAFRALARGEGGRRVGTATAVAVLAAVTAAAAHVGLAVGIADAAAPSIEACYGDQAAMASRGTPPGARRDALLDSLGECGNAEAWIEFAHDAGASDGDASVWLRTVEEFTGRTYARRTPRETGTLTDYYEFLTAICAVETAVRERACRTLDELDWE